MFTRRASPGDCIVYAAGVVRRLVDGRLGNIPPAEEFGRAFRRGRGRARARFPE
jgi:hypothetical protein